MKIEVIISIVSVVVAFLSFALAFFVYWRSRPYIQERKAHDSQMNIIACQSIVFWEQLQTLISANVNKYEVDPYIFNSLKENSKRLESSIEKAIALGLWHVFVPENKEHSSVLHVAFIQSLVDSSSLKTNNVDDWMKDHLLMGVIRIFEMCENYERLTPELKSSLKNKVVPEMKVRSWKYLG